MIKRLNYSCCSTLIDKLNESEENDNCENSDISKKAKILKDGHKAILKNFNNSIKI
jgi:hypothetical protein